VANKCLIQSQSASHNRPQNIAVSRFLTAKVAVYLQGNQSEIFVGKSGTWGTLFSQNVGFPLARYNFSTQQATTGYSIKELKV
jgi:putative alpha-1,2-mannosidase